MKVVIAGSSGLIGSALTQTLRQHKHEVIRLVRTAARTADAAEWNPAANSVSPLARTHLANADAVINLGGVGIGDKRWTDAYKAEIRSSRITTTSLLANTLAEIARADGVTPVFVSASAIGYYGDTGDTAVDESAGPGVGFLSDVCRDWEAAADPARAAGLRVVHPRTGLVMTRRGGALAKLLPIFKLGAGGRLGSGRQWWSHISLRDEIAALEFALTADIVGPVNLTAPEPARNSEVTEVLARLVKRKAFFPVPAAAMKAAIGEFSADVLGSQRVLPQVLIAAGFTFTDPTIADSLAAALAD